MENFNMDEFVKIAKEWFQLKHNAEVFGLKEANTLEELKSAIVEESTRFRAYLDFVDLFEANGIHIELKDFLAGLHKDYRKEYNNRRIMIMQRKIADIEDEIDSVKFLMSF